MSSKYLQTKLQGIAPTVAQIYNNHVILIEHKSGKITELTTGTFNSGTKEYKDMQEFLTRTGLSPEEVEMMYSEDTFLTENLKASHGDISKVSIASL